MNASLRPGALLEGKYRLEQVIGRGGMGVVYEAEHVLLRRKVAVKVLSTETPGDSETIARFQSEARSAASIRHPNIVEVTDFGLTDEHAPFFVMERLEGESLADRLHAKGRLSEREAVVIADAVLSALAAAHKVGVVHRDLKPENIFLASSERGEEVVKILDFGIAKIISGQRPSYPPPGRLPRSNRPPSLVMSQIYGTPGYMAPESILGLAEVDGRADLFAVGVLLYEMITGARPFNGRSEEDVLDATTMKPVVRPSELRPDITLPMELLVLTALARIASDRFQTAQEFLEYLTAAAVGRIPDRARLCKTEVAVTHSRPPAPAATSAAPRTPVRPSGRSSGYPSGRPSTPAAGLEIRRPSLEFEHPSWNVGSPYASMPAPKRGNPVWRFFAERVRIAVSPLAVLTLGGLFAAVYFLFFAEGSILRTGERQEEAEGAIERLEAESQGASEGNAATTVSHAPVAEDRVTIWLELSPSEASIYVRGRLAPERPLALKRSDRPVALDIKAAGYADQTVTVFPDREQTVRIELAKEKKASR